MPGPLTVILPKKETIPASVTGGLDSVAVRCPSHPIAKALIAAVGTAIAAPSANLSGSPSPTCFSHVLDDMQGRVDMIIDGGESDFGLESTIVKPESNGTLTLLRPGKITPEELSRVAKVIIAPAVLDKLKEGEVALSPGMKYRHYAPKAPLTLLSGDIDKIILYLREIQTKNCAFLCYEEDEALLSKSFPALKLFTFGKKLDQSEHAHRLFSLLREADKMNFEEIFAPLPTTDGIGLALYNRMIRAAAHRIIKL